MMKQQKKKLKMTFPGLYQIKYMSFFEKYNEIL